MITEIAALRIDPARASDFEAAVAAAKEHFRAAKGCHGMSLERVIETPGAYNLRVLWETVEAHTVDFRGSENFQKWRALAGPFFLEPPVVVHSETVGAYF
ncbi:MULTISPECIES: antibiotic biosynthesis monooxygenase [Asticcacaulis]|uniref:antibiotic biosynthesis monooxygenase family protein n=1 Tax=Asticcacaulis TaxID=76890 RepID=UPI001AE8F405|nr:MULTISPECIES: antibiotic biosynthesis monooxygenase family protein [Asticcacaulis]MBP2159216.1 quinol monooxygenase YgiN [Asticcacaulis solisilvae]MDR6800261.1 quinol monooxygenase YgiN [Asticcacaulis sp. BE141]